MNDKFVIVKKNTDINKLISLVKKEENIDLEIETIRRHVIAYDQFAFNIHTGDVVAAVIKGELVVSGNILKI